MRYVLLAAAALAAAAPLGAQSNAPRTAILEPVAEPDLVDSSTQADELGFRTGKDSRITVPVRVSGKGPFRFLVDTGSDRTSISRELAARLGLPMAATATLHTVTGVSQVQTAVVRQLQLSRTEVERIDAPLLEAAHVGADGILGIDSLRSQRVLFNFRSKTLSIVPSQDRVQPAREGDIVVRGRLKNGRLVLTRARADDSQVTVVIDTGSEVSIGNDALRRRLERRGKLRRKGSIQLESVTGELLSGEYAFIEKLEIGGIGLGDLAVVFADAHTFNKLGLEDRPALLLGMNALKAFEKVSIDFANKKLRVMLPERSEAGAGVMAGR